MICVNMRMITNCQLPTLAAILLLLGPPGFCQLTSHQRRRINARRQYKGYREVLRAANMTSFPEGDIRNLFLEGHELSQQSNDRKLINSQPEVTTKVVKTHIASTNVAASSLSRRHRKKGGRKGRKRHRKPSKSRLATPGTLWQKKLFTMRREETEQLLREESNELESRPTKTQSTGQSVKVSSRNESRKDRRRKNKYRRRPATARPIKGQKALSLNIARLKQRCKTKPMKQEIKVDGCLSTSIMNNLCYGQCNSFYIPEIRGRGNGPPSFVSCGFCRPKTVRPVYVTLRCTSRRGHMRLKRKKVSYVKKCRCMEQEIDIGTL